MPGIDYIGSLEYTYVFTADAIAARIEAGGCPALQDRQQDVLAGQSRGAAKQSAAAGAVECIDVAFGQAPPRLRGDLHAAGAAHVQDVGQSHAGQRLPPLGCPRSTAVQARRRPRLGHMQRHRIRVDGRSR